jgi:hypothetical protein
VLAYYKLPADCVCAVHTQLPGRLYKEMRLMAMELMKMKMKDEINFEIYNSYLRTYDFYGPVCNAFVAGKSITRASGRGLGPGNQDFFVKWHRAVRRVPFGA